MSYKLNLGQTADKIKPAVSSSIKKALEHYSKAIDYNPNHNLAFFRIGRLSFILNDNDKSQDNLSKAAMINNEHAETQFYLGMLSKNDKDSTLAKKHFYKALELNPEFPEAYFELAVHSESNGDISEAKIHFQKATEVDQNYAEAYFNLARLCSTNPSEFEQAYRNFETALEIDPEYEICHYFFGKLLIKGSQVTKDGSLVHKPDLKEAEFHFLEALRINPNSSISLFELGKLCPQKRCFMKHISLLPKRSKLIRNLPMPITNSLYS